MSDAANRHVDLAPDAEAAPAALPPAGDGEASPPSRPQFDLAALRAKINRPSYDDRLRAAAMREVKEHPAASRAESFKRAAEIAGFVPRVRGRRLSRTEARARRKRFAAVLGSALDASRRRRRDTGAGRTRHRRAPVASASRRRGSRRATGSGDRAGPADDPDEPPAAGGDSCGDWRRR